MRGAKFIKTTMFLLTCYSLFFLPGSIFLAFTKNSGPTQSASDPTLRVWLGRCPDEVLFMFNWTRPVSADDKLIKIQYITWWQKLPPYCQHNHTDKFFYLGNEVPMDVQGFFEDTLHIVMGLQQDTGGVWLLFHKVEERLHLPLCESQDGVQVVHNTVW